MLYCATTVGIALHEIDVEPADRVYLSIWEVRGRFNLFKMPPCPSLRKLEKCLPNCQSLLIGGLQKRLIRRFRNDTSLPLHFRNAIPEGGQITGSTFCIDTIYHSAA